MAKQRLLQLYPQVQNFQNHSKSDVTTRESQQTQPRADAASNVEATAPSHSTPRTKSANDQVWAFQSLPTPALQGPGDGSLNRFELEITHDIDFLRLRALARNELEALVCLRLHAKSQPLCIGPRSMLRGCSQSLFASCAHACVGIMPGCLMPTPVKTSRNSHRNTTSHRDSCPGTIVEIPSISTSRFKTSMSPGMCVE